MRRAALIVKADTLLVRGPPWPSELTLNFAARCDHATTASPAEPAKLSIRKWGAIMYALANIDFSNRFGVIVSELPDEIDDKDQTLDAKRGAALIDLEMAVFAAA